jgi:hypothetical protein
MANGARWRHPSHLDISEPLSKHEALAQLVVQLPRQLRQAQSRSLTFRDVVLKTGCMRDPVALSESTLLKCLSAESDLLVEWLRFSADKRNNDGCFFRRLGEQTFEVGAADRPIALVVNGAFEACVGYILRELCETNTELLEPPNDDAEHLLSIVDDVFTLAARGSIVVPGPRLSTFSQAREYRVTLRRPDGSTTLTELRLAVQFERPPPLVQRYASLLPALDKQEIPTGSQIWLRSERG